ncbi:hypothetical protein HanRHA438_Chr10g0439711 [Helianthus annuus]|nr:hypothetical protein HanRHA438_Chr10g0439711 [Helianthus annuus]
MSPALGFHPAIFAGATKMRMRTERGGRLGLCGDIVLLCCWNRDLYSLLFSGLLKRYIFRFSTG